jgi:hypothetical protein
MAFSFVSRALKYEIVTVPQIGGLFRAGLDKRQHEVDRTGHVAGRAPVLRDRRGGIPQADSTSAEWSRINGFCDHASVLFDHAMLRKQTRIEKSTIGRARPVQICDEVNKACPIERLQASFQICPSAAFL